MSDKIIEEVFKAKSQIRDLRIVVFVMGFVIIISYNFFNYILS